MRMLKNSGVGFLVSFIGSLPLGYLNIAGLEIYGFSGLAALLQFLLGVVSVEVFVIYFTLVFADKLLEKKKLMQFIEGFSVLFMLFLAYLFYTNANDEFSHNWSVNRYGIYPAYITGIVLSTLNFLQLPFWASWNLYLLNKKYIYTQGSGKYAYVFGTAAGTFLGMLALILSFSELATLFFASFLMEIVACVFGIMGLLQGYGFYKKYYGPALRKK